MNAEPRVATPPLTTEQSATLAARLAETARREPAVVLGVLAYWLPKTPLQPPPRRHV